MGEPKPSSKPTRLVTGPRVARITILVFLLVWNGGLWLLLRHSHPAGLFKDIDLEPIAAGIGFVVFVAAYLVVTRTWHSAWHRRAFCAFVVAVGFIAYIVVFVLATRYWLIAGAVWGGTIFGLVAVIPLWEPGST
jgi:hypothetical protein